MPTEIWRQLRGLRGLPEEKKKKENKEKKEEAEATLIKSRDPHPAGGENAPSRVFPCLIHLWAIRISALHGHHATIFDRCTCTWCISMAKVGIRYEFRVDLFRSSI